MGRLSSLHLSTRTLEKRIKPSNCRPEKERNKMVKRNKNGSDITISIPKKFGKKIAEKLGLD
jgi:hypothetical protein